MKTKNDLLFREYLASERTDLAIDRTILSYIRTAMTIVVVGISLIKFFQEEYIHVLGSSLILTSIGLILVGFYRSYKLKNKIKKFFKRFH